ncbi:hypothetical protein E4T56_gene14728 [Termitomyces sp. T112]|nr:hypothetical protein E4T56_gene14728 [Termitomyces sp. T112]
MVAVPAFTYAADMWFIGVTTPLDGGRRSGSVLVIKKLCHTQYKAAKLVTSVLSTTAGDALDIHANLLLMDLLFWKVLTHAAVRILSLPPPHPLHSLAHQAANWFVRRHRSPLHKLFSFTGVDPTSIETVHSIHRQPNYHPSLTTHIMDDKDAALVAITNTHVSTSISVYCDGYGFEGGIGTSAVLYVNCWETSYLTYCLGSDAEHTVYEGKAMGFTLGLHLLTSVVHSIDGQHWLGMRPSYSSPIARLTVGHLSPSKTPSHPTSVLLGSYQGSMA